MPRLSDGAAAQLSASDWPGNVRQVRNVAERLILRAKNGIITIADLPREVLSADAPKAAPAAHLDPRPICEQLFDRMVRRSESFWTVVYEPFMSRDLTRDDLRAIVRHGLNLTPRQLQGHGAVVQCARGLQAVIELPAEVSVPSSHPGIPDRVDSSCRPERVLERAVGD